MKRVAELDQQINRLRASLDSVEGTPTEVYTRIVGYYRSLKNWNRGKREEYRHRRTFHGTATGVGAAAYPGSERPEPATAPPERAQSVARFAAGPDRSAVAVLAAPPKTQTMAATSYLYFYRQTCPNCPPVCSRLESIPIGGHHVDVDTPEGRDLAVRYEILATPTVVFLDDHQTAVTQAHSVQEIARLFRDPE